jgi:hypothetical protein
VLGAVVLHLTLVGFQWIALVSVFFSFGTF